MRYELLIGFRYLRARRREAFISLITMISILGVTISVMTLDITLSVMTGFENDLRDRILGFSPHIIVTSYSGPVEDAAKLIEGLTGARGVEAAAPYVYAQAMVSRGPNVSGVFLRGVNPERANDVVDIGRYLKSGSFTEMGRLHEVQIDDTGRTAKLGGIIIGEELGRSLGAAKGDIVSVVIPTGTPSPIGMVPRIKRFVVAGIFNSGMFEYDAAFVYLAIDDAQKLLGLKGTVTGIEIRTTDLEQASRIAGRLEREVLQFPYEARDWMQLNRNIFIALRLLKLAYFLVLSLMLVVAGFSILATLIMVVM
ncbi:MAG: ABC transporter permease, partial [Candidatus Binatia bacterium]